MLNIQDPLLNVLSWYDPRNTFCSPWKVITCDPHFRWLRQTSQAADYGRDGAKQTNIWAHRWGCFFEPTLSCVDTPVEIAGAGLLSRFHFSGTCLNLPTIINVNSLSDDDVPLGKIISFYWRYSFINDKIVLTGTYSNFLNTQFKSHAISMGIRIQFLCEIKLIYFW